MNERIKLLATQAANYANTYDDAGADIWFEMYNQKFAELLVRECARIADMVSENKVEWVGGNILVYFGVKE